MYYIGTSGWVFADWTDDFYPKNLGRSRWLAYYAQHFNTVEVNATFYRPFKESTYLKWYQQAPDDFKYILKVPKIVRHQKLLEDTDEIINTLEKYALMLQEKLDIKGYNLVQDGKFGPLTETAVMRFQTAKGIAAVGYVGPSTRTALNNS